VKSIELKKNSALNRERLFNIPFIAVLGYLFVEYFRPQDWVPALENAPLGMIVQVFCFTALLTNIPKKLSRMSILLAVFLLVIAKSVPFAYNNFYAYRETKAFAFMLFGGLLPMMVFVNSIERMSTLFRSFILIVVFHSLMGLVYGRGMGGFMGDENDFALLLNMTMPFSYFLISSEKSPMWKVILFVSIGLFTLANAASLSRGGFLGLVAVGLYCLYKTKRRVTAAIIIVMVIGCMAALAPEKYWDEMATIATAHQKGDTGEERLFLWALAWRMFLDNPIMGVGAGNFPATADLYYKSEEKHEREGMWHGTSYWGRSCHSAYFTLISELAIPGLILFVSIIWVFWRNMTEVEKSAYNIEKYRRSGRHHVSVGEERYYNYTMALKGAMIGYLSTGAFLSVLYYPFLWTLIAMSEIVRQNFKKDVDDIAKK